MVKKKKCTILVIDVDNGEAMEVCGHETYGRSLYFPFNVVINLKLLKKIKPLKSVLNRIK